MIKRLIGSYGWRGIDTGYKTLDKISAVNGWLHTAEICALFHFAKEALVLTDKLVELGSYQGRSTITLALACKSLKRGKVWAIDPHNLQLENTLLILKRNLRRFSVSKYVNIVNATSDKAYESREIPHYSLIFIDGNHELSQVAKDVKNYENGLVNRGYLLIHDVLNVYGPQTMFLKLLLSPSYVFLCNVGDLACFQRSSKLNLKNWINKLMVYMLYKVFLKFYKSHNDIYVFPDLLMPLNNKRKNKTRSKR